jgi:hypothetical protein
MKVRGGADSLGVPRQQALGPRPGFERGTRLRGKSQDDDRVVSQMPTNAGQVDVDVDPKAPEIFGGAETRSKEQRRGSISARREDDLSSEERFVRRREADADGAPVFQNEPVDQDGGADRKIRASPRGSEIGSTLYFAECRRAC